MSYPPPQRSKNGSGNNRSLFSDSKPKSERDPLLQKSRKQHEESGTVQTAEDGSLRRVDKRLEGYHSGVIRSRRSSRSPVNQQQQQLSSNTTPSAFVSLKQPPARQQPTHNRQGNNMLRSTNSADASSSLLSISHDPQGHGQQQSDDDVLIVRRSASLPQQHQQQHLQGFNGHDGYEPIHDEALPATSAAIEGRSHIQQSLMEAGMPQQFSPPLTVDRGGGRRDEPFILSQHSFGTTETPAASLPRGQNRITSNTNNNSSGSTPYTQNTQLSANDNRSGRSQRSSTTHTPSVGSTTTGSDLHGDQKSVGGSVSAGGGSAHHRHHHRYNLDQQHQHHQQHQSSVSSSTHTSSQQSPQPPPLLEIPEEIYVVRKAALQVLKPLTKTWVVISVGFALTVLFGTARWTRLMPGLPFWFILLPCWAAHCGLLWLHVLSAQALSTFIAEANESRQRPDSRDHLNRTEYLPLLQRSLKFGLKTGLLSFFVFIFEILIYVRLARGTISLSAAFIPLWLLVMGGILDGLICKTQHFLRVVCWLLTFAAMTLTVLKVDYHYDSIRWRTVISPVVAVLSIASATLIYIVYGHQVGYYRLTESQLTAGNLYSLAALICMVLMIMIGEVIPLSRPVEIQSRLFVVVLAPLVVCLVGMGAWVVSRDEFGRLLLYGGQSAVHPMRLRWETNGWTCVQGKGVTVIPMFGEVSFQPRERPFDAQSKPRYLELCTCCSGSCYPYEEEDEETVHLTDIAYHPYLDPSQMSRHTYAMRGGM